MFFQSEIFLQSEIFHVCWEGRRAQEGMFVYLSFKYFSHFTYVFSHVLIDTLPSIFVPRITSHVTFIIEQKILFCWFRITYVFRGRQVDRDRGRGLAVRRGRILRLRFRGPRSPSRS